MEEQLEFAFEYTERHPKSENNLKNFIERSLWEIDTAFGSFSPEPNCEQLELSL